MHRRSTILALGAIITGCASTDPATQQVNDVLTVGDRVRIGGGYDMEPRWMMGRRNHHGTVISFIPGQNTMPAAVVKIDNPITVEDVTGTIVVMELRYVGAKWGKTETVHVELCDFEPEPRPTGDRRHGKWVESHATYVLEK